MSISVGGLCPGPSGTHRVFWWVQTWSWLVVFSWAGAVPGAAAVGESPLVVELSDMLTWSVLGLR